MFGIVVAVGILIWLAFMYREVIRSGGGAFVFWAMLIGGVVGFFMAGPMGAVAMAALGPWAIGMFWTAGHGWGRVVRGKYPDHTWGHDIDGRSN